MITYNYKITCIQSYTNLSLRAQVYIFLNCIYTVMAVLGAQCCVRAHWVVASRGCSLAVLRWLLIAADSLLAELVLRGHWLQ